MKIGEVSAASGVSQRMIRHYEKIGLIPEVARRDSGCWDYDQRDLHNVRFIGRTRDLGFPIEIFRCLWRDRGAGFLGAGLTHRMYHMMF